VKKVWVQHMMLMADGHSDPGNNATHTTIILFRCLYNKQNKNENVDGICVRSVAGVEGCDFLCRSTRQSTDASYVFGPIVTNLTDLGYEPGKNLVRLGC
jgi:predicted metal-binding protein